MMLQYINKSLMTRVFNSNEFKGWLLSRRWFGDKSALSNLQFKCSLDYFEIISERLLLSIIKIETPEYTKSYYLPLIYYEELTDILEAIENTTENVVLLTENTFSKKQVINIEGEQTIFTLNLLEGEYCLYYWKKIIFDKTISEKFPALSLRLNLYTEQFQDADNKAIVQNLIEVSLNPDRYTLSLKQLGGGHTTNNIFLLKIKDIKIPDGSSFFYILKSYKEYAEIIEPYKLLILVKNSFPNAPKIYGTITIQEIQTISILESIPNKGNLGEIYWNELNNMIKSVFKNIKADYSKYLEKIEISKLIKANCIETLKISEEIGKNIKKLHESLIFPEDDNYKLETVESQSFLKKYTEKLNLMIDNLQNKMKQRSKDAFYNLPKINSILIDTKDIIKKLRENFKDSEVKIQPVHQDLHMEQVLYDKSNGQYIFNFVDFEGDPQLPISGKRGKFPVEKDLAAFLRAVNYIKFNTLLGFIEEKAIQKDKYEVPEEILYGMFFRKAAKPINQTLEILSNLLNTWEQKVLGRIVFYLQPNIPLTNYFTIERVLNELNYEILFRPNKIIIPILGLKQITERT